MTDAQGQPGTRRTRAKKHEAAKRDARMIRALASGATIEEVAARETLSLKRARELVSAFFARRAADPPAEFVHLQIRRLSEAMIVAHAAMGGGNLRAVDRVVRITREFDRYYALAATVPAPLAAPAEPALPPPPLALPPPAPAEDAVEESASNVEVVGREPETI